MFPPFPQELAHHYCLQLISRIQKGDIELRQISKESEERKGQGVMLGSLVCWNNITNSRIILYAVSGNSKILSGNHTQNEIFVPSIISVDDVNNALAENDEEIHKLTDQINKLKTNSTGAITTDSLDDTQITQNTTAVTEHVEALIQKRTKLTTQSLQKIFNLYTFTDFQGKTITLNEIIKKHNNRLPPTGTGDCCAPKLLSYAFKNNLEPVSMDEVYFGGNTKNKTNGESYPPCNERCGYILPHILGLEILYRDKDIVIINKQSGLLSVPGRGEDKQDCAENRLKKLFPECIFQPAVHRLDMETSGILILALNQKAHKNLEEQFASGKIHKKYIALIDGIVRGKPEGHIELKFRLDPENRPHQIYDEKNGKLGITDWKKIAIEKWTNPLTNELKTVTRIEFSPKTGRTHQLRLASYHEKGLTHPILGDTLYGTCNPGERLMLHAYFIEFNHPTSNERIKITCNPDF